MCKASLYLTVILSKVRGWNNVAWEGAQRKIAPSRFWASSRLSVKVSQTLQLRLFSSYPLYQLGWFLSFCLHYFGFSTRFPNALDKLLLGNLSADTLIHHLSYVSPCTSPSEQRGSSNALKPLLAIREWPNAQLSIKTKCKVLIIHYLHGCNHTSSKSSQSNNPCSPPDAHQQQYWSLSSCIISGRYRHAESFAIYRISQAEKPTLATSVTS